MDPGRGGRQSINQRSRVAKPALGSPFGVREMATQIVMDRTGDTRHTFDIHDRAEVEKAERRFKELTGAGFTAAVRSGPGEQRVIRSFDPMAEETLFIRVLLVADGSDPADRPGDMLVRPGLAWHIAAFGAFAGRGAIWFLQQIVPLRNRGASADPVEGLALAE